MPLNQEQSQETRKSNDFVIRDGFPALRNEKGEPVIDGIDPIPRAPFLSYSSALKFENENFLSTFLEDCAMVFSARTKSDDAAYSAGVTYFVPAVMKPRCALEVLAYDIFREHTKDLPKGSFLPEQSGAEWWTLVLNGNPPTENADDETEEDHDEVGMHFDADYGLEEQAPGLLLHPRIATVTYLSNAGAPTLVLDRKSPRPNQVDTLGGEVCRGWLSGPQVGKHIAFNGSLLHGAPASFFPGLDLSSNEKEEPPNKKQKVESPFETPLTAKAPVTGGMLQGQRITFLVNIWLNHCPMDAELLDDDILDQLKSSPDLGFQLSIKTPDALETMTLAPSQQEPAGEEETIICGRVVTVFYNGDIGKQHEVCRRTCQERKSVQLEFEKGTLVLEVGGLSTDSDNEDARANE